jgi:hypothetical protein
MYYLV